MMRNWLAAGLLAFSSLCAPSLHAAPPPLSVYGSLPGFERASLSPSGDHIAIIGRMDGKRMLVVMDAGRKVLLRMDTGALKIRGISWAGDQSVLIHYSNTVNLYGFTTDKAELGTVAVVPIDGSKIWQVFGHDNDVTGGVWGSYGMVQRDGHWYGYYGGVTLVETMMGGPRHLPPGTVRPDLYEVDMATGKHRIIAHRADDPGEQTHWLVDGQGRVAATLSLERSDGSWTIRGAAHQALVKGKNPEGDVGIDGFTPDGASIVYHQKDEASGMVQRFSVPSAGGTPQPFLADKTVKGLYIGAGHSIDGFREDSINNVSHFFDPARDKLYHAARNAFPGERMILEDSNNAFTCLLIQTEGPQDAGSWYVIDLATHHADPLGATYMVDGDDVGPMKMLPYTAADGLKMEGVLTLPPPSTLPGGAAKMLPAVILPHDGPTAHDVPGFDWIAQSFASRGYAVFQPNFRGSTGYGEGFIHAGNGEWGRKMQTDISDGLAELVRQGIVDPARVCIVGANYGGYAALAGVSLQQGIYRCAVAYAGLSDLNRLIDDKDSASASDPMLMRNLKAEVGQGRDLKLVSPIRFAGNVSVPVLLIHGKDDTVVNLNQSSRMADALRHAGKQVDFITLPGEDHWLSKGETRLAMLQAAMDFVMKNNPPGPSR